MTLIVLAVWNRDVYGPHHYYFLATFLASLVDIALALFVINIIVGVTLP